VAGSAPLNNLRDHPTAPIPINPTARKDQPMSKTYGTLYDMSTGEEIGPATREQREASDAAGETGAFCVDRDLEPCDVSADPQVFGPLRTVYVQP
jgi:hypothetical protein